MQVRCPTSPIKSSRSCSGTKCVVVQATIQFYHYLIKHRTREDGENMYMWGKWESTMSIHQFLKMTARWFIIKEPVTNIHSPICSRAAWPPLWLVTWFKIQIDSLSHALKEPTCTKTAAGPLPSKLNMDGYGRTDLQTFVFSDLCWERVGATLWRHRL